MPTSVSSTSDASPPTSLLLKQLLAAQRASALPEQLLHMASCSKAGGGDDDVLCTSPEPVRVYRPLLHTLLVELEFRPYRSSSAASASSTARLIYLGRYVNDELSQSAFALFVARVRALSAPNAQAIRFISYDM